MINHPLLTKPNKVMAESNRSQLRVYCSRAILPDLSTEQGFATIPGGFVTAASYSHQELGQRVHRFRCETTQDPSWKRHGHQRGG